MKTISGTLLSLAVFSTFALGDGLPINRETNEITSAHQVLDLSESQQEEVETLGTLTLSAEQWQKLREISPSCPKRIEQIVPISYNDCGCDLLGVFGIQTSSDKVAVLDWVVARGGKMPSLKNDISSGADIRLRMDGNGNFYYDGSQIPLDELCKMFAESKSSKGARMFGIVRPLGVKRDAPVAKEHLDAIVKAAEAAGWQEWNLSYDTE